MNILRKYFSGGLLLLSSVIIVYFRPSAAGSGVPELIGFLNGNFIRRIFNLKTFLAKFISCFLSVGCGMPVGPEGPMIHLGSIIGAGLSQFQSKTIGFQLPFFERFRNPEDRRNFISAGAAAGIASAFGAPVGGLLFAMEEMSSFWTMELSWQVLFCSMLSAFTTDLFNSSFQNFKYSGPFGLFKTNKYILFQIEEGIDLNIIGLIPAVILGVFGGLFGSLFIVMNLQMAKFRKLILSKISKDWMKDIAKVLEPMTIILVYTTISVLLPALFGCTPMSCVLVLDGALDDMVCQSSAVSGATFVSLVVAKPSVETYTCPVNITQLNNGTDFFDGSYNQAATLFFVTGEKAIKHLFSRNTHLEFGYGPLILFFIFYFIFSCWSSGTHISCGLMVPMILIGSLYGRILGRVCVDIFGVNDGPYWDWMDPGAFALLGAVSFMGGVTRLTMSLAVIMVEITNDIQFLLLIIVTIMFSKWTGDMLTHSLYHELMETKHIPYLAEEADVKFNTKERESLENHRVKEIMSCPVNTIHEVESLHKLVDVLSSTHHGGFPITDEDNRFLGLITRFELLVIFIRAINNKEFINQTEDGLMEPSVEYSDINRMRGHYMSDPALHQGLLEQIKTSGDKNLRINLARYVNRSAISIPETFSLQRTYTMFRVMGLRHLTVVDTGNRVTGIVTRRDLQNSNMMSRLAESKSNSNPI